MHVTRWEGGEGAMFCVFEVVKRTEKCYDLLQT